MQPQYVDTSDSAQKNAVATVLEILKTSKVKLYGEGPSIFVLESAMPAAIKALYKAGFHPTNGPVFFSDVLALRRLSVLVEVSLPFVKYGADVVVNRLKKQTPLSITPFALTKEAVLARTKEDSLIDISYAGILKLYEQREQLNAWRNHMQFMLPDDHQIAAAIALLDRCVLDRKSGSAVDYDRYVVRWGMTAAKRSARLLFVPSRRLYELDVKIDRFSWSSAGRDLNYPETAEELSLNVKRHLESEGDASPYLSITDFHRRMSVHFSDMASPHYDGTKHLLGVTSDVSRR